MHRNIIALLVIIAMLAVVYGVFALTTRMAPRKKRLVKMQRHVGVKLLALLGLWGCESVVEPVVLGPATRGTDDADDTDTGDTDVSTDASVNSATDTAVDTAYDTDADTATEAVVDSDTWIEISCYEKVATPEDNIFIDGQPSGEVIELDEMVVTGTYDKLYAIVPSYRIVDDNENEVAAGNINGVPQDGEMMQFHIFLPDTLADDTYQLFLYGTTIENVRTYNTYPAKEYTLEINL